MLLLHVFHNVGQDKPIGPTATLAYQHKPRIQNGRHHRKAKTLTSRMPRAFCQHLWCANILTKQKNVTEPAELTENHESGMLLKPEIVSSISSPPSSSLLDKNSINSMKIFIHRWHVGPMSIFSHKTLIVDTTLSPANSWNGLQIKMNIMAWSCGVAKRGEPVVVEWV